MDIYIMTSNDVLSNFCCWAVNLNHTCTEVRINVINNPNWNESYSQFDNINIRKSKREPFSMHKLIINYQNKPIDLLTNCMTNWSSVACNRLVLQAQEKMERIVQYTSPGHQIWRMWRLTWWLGHLKDEEVAKTHRIIYQYWW